MKKNKTEDEVFADEVIEDTVSSESEVFGNETVKQSNSEREETVNIPMAQWEKFQSQQADLMNKVNKMSNDETGQNPALDLLALKNQKAEISLTFFSDIENTDKVYFLSEFIDYKLGLGRTASSIAKRVYNEETKANDLVPFVQINLVDIATGKSEIREVKQLDIIKSDYYFAKKFTVMEEKRENHTIDGEVVSITEYVEGKEGRLTGKSIGQVKANSMYVDRAFVVAVEGKVYTIKENVCNIKLA